jgi:hypothetical protein
MTQTTKYAFIIYEIKGNNPLWTAPFALSFVASLPDIEAAEQWIVNEGKNEVNYTILRVFRKS